MTLGNISTHPIPLSVIKDVHEDDIHSLIRLGDGTFASGSKDASIRLWDRNWNLQKTLKESGSDYRYWITAMTVIDSNYFAAGTRDGSITVWSNEGKKTSYRKRQQNVGNRSKERNLYRINCLHTLPVKNSQYLFLVGLPTRLSTWKWNWNNELKEVLSTPVHDNDWVYSIKPLKQNHYFVAIGSALEIWRNDQTDQGMINCWKQHQVVFQENSSEISYEGKRQRPHISSMEFITPEKMALACFGGYVKILDIEKEMEVSTFKEHENRVWTVVKTAEQLFASSADDGTALLWDLRQPVPITRVVAVCSARISCLLSLDSHTLVGASCPKDVKAAEDKGSFTFWDLRK